MKEGLRARGGWMELSGVEAKDYLCEEVSDWMVCFDIY